MNLIFLEKHFNLGSTISYFQQQYLDAVPASNGFRVKPKYSAGRTNILANNPARPRSYVLSAYYCPRSSPFNAEATAHANQTQQFPGRH